MVADRQAALIGGTTEAASTAPGPPTPTWCLWHTGAFWQELFTQRLGQELPVEMLAHLAPLNQAVLGRE